MNFTRRALLLAAAQAGGQSGLVRYLGLSDVQEIINQRALLGGPGIPDAADWDRWVRAQDRQIRARIDAGVEDSISNLILYGTSFTTLPRLENAEGDASARVSAMAQALSRPRRNPRLRFVSEYLERRGIGAASIEAFLAANLRRFAQEQRQHQETLHAAARTGDPGAKLFAQSTLYERRGLSVDTSLLPNFAVETTLEALLKKKVLDAGRIRRIGIIGPGLDFADKLSGYDFYPLQTLQPFAILEAALRLRLADAARLRVVCLDLNPAVIAHLRNLPLPYVIQLPRDESASWTPEAVAYWRNFGGLIGSDVPPLAVPAKLRGLALRAVAVAARHCESLEALDLNIVTQTLEGAAFDLIVATNILVYYSRFEQAIAMAGIARLMSPGAVFIANHALPAQRPAALEYLGRRSVSYSAQGAYGDEVVVYRRK